MSYSTGSSAVRIFVSMSLSSCRPEYSVVVLPEPVGPVTMTMPFGLRISSRKSPGRRRRRPRRVEAQLVFDRSSTRITTDSPCIVGKHRDTKVNRVAADHQLDTAVLRQTPLGDVQVRHDLDTARDRRARCFGGGTISYSTPSMRYRILNSFSNGSKWMSDALSLIACSSTRFSSFTTLLSPARLELPRPRGRSTDRVKVGHESQLHHHLAQRRALPLLAELKLPGQRLVDLLAGHAPHLGQGSPDPSALEFGDVDLGRHSRLPFSLPDGVRSALDPDPPPP
jgi:hypothetical protein